MRYLTIILLLLIPTIASAQCVWTITDIRTDANDGSIVVETSYDLNNGARKEVGRTRYLETSGTLNQIKQLARADIVEYCQKLIYEIPANKEFVKAQALAIQKNLSDPVSSDLYSQFIGATGSETQVIRSFKGKDIKITYDQKNTVTDTVTP